MPRLLRMMLELSRLLGDFLNDLRPANSRFSQNLPLVKWYHSELNPQDAFQGEAAEGGEEKKDDEPV